MWFFVFPIGYSLILWSCIRTQLLRPCAAFPFHNLFLHVMCCISERFLKSMVLFPAFPFMLSIFIKLLYYGNVIYIRFLFCVSCPLELLWYVLDNWSLSFISFKTPVVVLLTLFSTYNLLTICTVLLTLILQQMSNLLISWFNSNCM